MNTKLIFEALPHVNTIWVTKDGHFHLHPNNGGEQIDRTDVEQAKVQPDEVQPEEVSQTRPKGRQKANK